LRTGKPVHSVETEVTLSLKNAQVHSWVEISVDPLVLEGKKHAVIAINNIDERKRAEEATRTALERFYLVLSSMPLGVLLVTEDGRVEFANQTFCDIFNLKELPEELKAITSHDMIEKIRPSYMDPEEAEARIMEIVDQAKPVKDEDVLMKGERTFLRDFVPIRLGENKYGRLWIHKDITDRKRAEVELRESRERLDLALISSGMATFNWDIVQNKRIWSEGVHRLVGTSPESFTGSAEEFFQRIHPEDRSSVQANLAKALEAGVYETDYRVIWPDGTIRHLTARGKVHRNDAGAAISMTGVCWDITERSLMEGELLKLNRVLWALSNSSQAIMRAETESELLQAVCRNIVDDCGYLMAWVGIAEDDAAKSVRPVAQAGLEAGYLNTLNLTWADTERGRGPTGTAIRTGKPSLCKNMLTDPAFLPWRDEALKRGYASSAVLPLKIAERVIGALTIYSKHPDPFSDDEIRLLQDLANDLAQGIANLRIRAQNAKAEAVVRQSLQRFELLAHTAGALLQTLEPEKLVDSLCHKVMGFLDCQAFFNFFVDEQAARLRMNACAGIPEEDARRIEWLDFGVAVCGCVARDGNRIVAEHIPTTSDPRTDLIRSFGIKAYACHPLLGTNGNVIGTLSFGTRTRETFSEGDLSLMRAVSDQVSMAMIRMRDAKALQQSQLDIARVQVMTTERQRLYSVLETLPVSVVLLTPDHHITFSNKFFRERFGNNQGRCCYEHLFNRTAPCENCETYQVLKTNTPHNWEWCGPDGRDYDLHVFPFKELDGVIHIMKMGIDVTDRKRAQEALLVAQEEMDRARRLSDIGTLAATVAHELRNPLAAISMASENIKRKAQNPNLEKHLSNIALKVTESNQIISNLLFYSRLKPPHHEAISLAPIIEECVEIVEKSANKQVAFAIDVDDVAIMADPLQMKEVFNNILHNAYDAAPLEGGEIGIVGRQENGFYKVVVKDNGHGMDVEQKKKAFDPFFTTKAKGTGLGLSVCQQIVTFHGGTIGIESEPGKGAAVFVTLPLGHVIG
jgi:PAS domain S-box-containing protein